MSDDLYISGRDGLMARCTHATGMFKLSDYKDLGLASLQQVTETLIGGQPLIMVLERTPW